MYESDVDAETLTFNATFFREELESALSVFSETIFNPKFTQSEIDEKLNSTNSNFEEQYENPGIFNVN
jgi:predicted Zn-dependent peptidase